MNKLYLLSVLMKVSVQWEALQMECLKIAYTVATYTCLYGVLHVACKHTYTYYARPVVL